MKKVVYIVLAFLFLLPCSFYPDQISTYMEIKNAVSDEIISIIESRYENFIKISDLFLEKFGYENYLKNKDNLFDASLDVIALKKFFKTKFDNKEIDKMFQLLNLYHIRLDLVNNRNAYIDALREPLDEFGNYRWAEYQRIPGIVETKSYTVSATNTNGGTLQEEAASFIKAYQIRVYCPEDRSAFRGNRDFYLGSVSILYKNKNEALWKKVIQKYNKWFKRKQSVTIDLPEIPDLVEVKFTLGTKEEHRGKAIAQLHAVHPVLTDIKANPMFPLIMDLAALPNVNQIRSMSAAKVKNVIASLNRINRKVYVSDAYPQESVPFNPGTQTTGTLPNQSGLRTEIEYLKNLILQKESYEKLFFEISRIIQNNF